MNHDKKKSLAGLGLLQTVLIFGAKETGCGRTQKTWGVLARAGMVWGWKLAWRLAHCVFQIVDNIKYTTLGLRVRR
jgi:hypothetical protein